jgi:monofunctional glycosyltransferase
VKHTAAPPSTVRRWLGRFAVLLGLLLLLPYAVAPLYRVVDPISTPMLWRMFRGARIEHIRVPIGQIAPALPLAVIIAEDAQLCRHSGIDWRGIEEAMADAEQGEKLRGGSSIPQQLAKNLFLWQGRSYVRKALEIPLALWLDLMLGKRRLMEIYLNVAEWGPDGEFGIEAGARRAFHRSARNLTLRDAALLAAVLPNPRQRDAGRPRPIVRRLAALYEGRARQWPELDACVRRQR